MTDFSHVPKAGKFVVEDDVPSFTGHTMGKTYIYYRKTAGLIMTRGKCLSFQSFYCGRLIDLFFSFVQSLKKNHAKYLLLNLQIFFSRREVRYIIAKEIIWQQVCEKVSLQTDALT